MRPANAMGDLQELRVSTVPSYLSVRTSNPALGPLRTLRSRDSPSQRVTRKLSCVAHT